MSFVDSEVIITNTIVKEYDIETGNKQINHYRMMKEIGRGVHGKVKLAQDITTGRSAVKIVDKRNQKRRMGHGLKENGLKMEREISILKKCRHPNVVQLLEVMDNPESKKMYIVLEYTCGEIEWRQDEKPVLSIEESRRIFRDIVNGLDYRIIHRDIKPANVLLSENRVAKISDFGVSYYNPLLAKDSRIEPTQDLILRMEKELAETAGTPAFFAPELCYAGEGKRSRISKAIDVWALGVTLYCLLFGQCPFTASSEFELFEIIPYQPLTFPFAIEDDLQDLLKSLLEKLPEKRITLDKVKSHPWLLDWNHPSMMNRNLHTAAYFLFHFTIAFSRQRTSSLSL
ncbi:hypothetical protein CU098_004770 [Rhizopus stolonifer]|uniref:Protein kinase domain-containing protein n=1 Tax=Rhizopus stolonifer TaxID=4846 RepID=A0A367JH12_RHIST|nr:hypothetical protein CU098_004770 [Rhizopus stolonifer]